jgi:oxalate decarboxylase/phosphoglucose isomerase-like protein (cupin superfamily)
MIDLTNSGLPLGMNEETYRITMGEGLKSDGFSRKLTGQMAGLLADETGLEDLAGEPFYDVYRGIAFPEDEPLLRKYNFRYDITVIMPGTVNGECRKTSGHYHGWTPEGRHSYAEVYEVLKGTALYVLQKSPDFDSPDPGQVHIEDVILVTVPEGKTLRTFPAKIKVKFVTGANTFRKLKPTDFIVVADYNELKMNPSEKCNIYLRNVPDGITRATLAQKQVDYIIETP